VTTTPRRAGTRRTRRSLAVSALFLAGLGVLAGAGLLSWLVPAGYGLLSAVAVGMYRRDKSAAEQGRWRTSEAALHAVALLGGWPGALVARHAFRHKTLKQPFRTVFWLTVLGNCAVLAWLVTAGPATLR
jgi:uncharacterized membrane protein YsdA (DUF1294 family)